MLFLYRQYRSPSYPSYQEGKFNHLILICEQNIERRCEQNIERRRQELRLMHHHPNATSKTAN